MPQIQHFHDFIFKDYWPDFVNDYVSRNEFQGLNFCGMNVICKITKFTSLENLYEYGILLWIWHVLNSLKRKSFNRNPLYKYSTYINTLYMCVTMVSMSRSS